MEVSQESFERYKKASQEAQEKMAELTANIIKATTKLNDNEEQLRKATEDIKLLVAFIKSNGLKPPKINYAA